LATDERLAACRSGIPGGIELRPLARKEKPMRSLFRRSQWWLLTVASGGSLWALDACDAAVRDTVLNGLGSAATSLSSTFIQAFFQSLMTPDEGAATTVRAIVEHVPQFFA
jgi:hypothetical protein